MTMLIVSSMMDNSSSGYIDNYNGTALLIFFALFSIVIGAFSYAACNSSKGK